jgi:CPA2 family monovalent cation:H+ antiporter-2
MSHLPQLREVLVLLVAVLAIVPLFQRLRLGTVLGYLVLGLLIGPAGFSLVGDRAAALGLAELGVVFLLFAIGLEISLDRLKLFGRTVYLLAAAQILVTSLLLGAVTALAGIPPLGALIVGGALAFSSTAVVLQMLSERGQITGQFGRMAFAILLVQDLAVAPMLAFVAGAGQESSALLAALGVSALKFVAFFIFMVVLERTVLRPLLAIAAEATAPEVFTAATLLLVLGVGWLAEQVDLTMTVGAFAAGLLVANTEFRHQVAADIQPFRGLLLGLFFISVGMSVDLHHAAAHLLDLACIVLALMGTKLLSLYLLARIAGVARPRALALGALLSQGSEFAFIILPLAAERRLVDTETTQLLILAVGLSMALTPLGALIADRVRLRFAQPAPSRLGNLQRERGTIGEHVIIAGFGQVGMAVARHLAGLRIPLLILDLSPKRVMGSRARGLPVFYGNARRLDVLRAAGLDRAQTLVVAVPDASSTEQITAIARKARPTLQIIARVPDVSWVDRVRKAGANAVVVEGMTTAIELAERVMIVHAPERTSNME